MQLEEPSKFYKKRIIAGSVDDVRIRLVNAAENLGFDVIEEEPNIIGRKASKGLGLMSWNILDAESTITIRLKSLNENLTQITFDYSIPKYLGSDDQKILVQELDTILAFAKGRLIEKTCSVCETESIDESKFCRKCGNPLTAEQTDLEVLRMMAETRAGKGAVATSAFTTSLSAAAMLVLFLLNNASLIKPKLFVFLMIVGSVIFAGGLILNFFGLNRLKNALDKPEKNDPGIPRTFPEQNISRDPKELPAPDTGEFEDFESMRRPASVTEGTTNLLDPEMPNTREKEKVPVSKRRTTRDLN